MKRPDTPCAGCGKLLASSRGSLPAGERTCQACRAAARIKKCDICGQDFDSNPHTGTHYCSKDCYRLSIIPGMTSTCAWCGTEFKTKPSKQQQYCSKVCAMSRPKTSRIYVQECEECGHPFVSRRKGKILCGTECRDRRQAARYYTNPKYRDAIVAAGHARRASKLGVASNFKATLTYLVARDRGRCGICHKPVRAKRGPMRPSIDHIIPLSKGGTHTPENVQLAHLKCNRQKWNTGIGDQLLLIG